MFLLQVSFAYNPTFYFHTKKKLWRYISFSSTCFCYCRKHPNIGNNICHYHFLLASHFHDWFYVLRYNSDLSKLEWTLISTTSVIWQIDTNCSPFQLLNMSSFHIRFRTLKTNLLGLMSNFSTYYFKTGTICFLFLSSHVFTALEFDSNHFLIILWKIVKPRLKAFYLQRSKKCYNLETNFQKKVNFS